MNRSLVEWTPASVAGILNSTGHAQPKRGYRFGPFEFDPRTGELRKQGIPISLQPKVQQLLAILLEHPGDVVTREELRGRLWPDGTFVDFESGLNTTANRLRLRLSDAAANPCYVETLARNGYRFIAPVEHLDAPAEQQRTEPNAVGRHQAVRYWTWATAITICVMALASYLWFRSASEPIRFRALTFRRGQVTGARFLLDGQSVVYTAQWEHHPRQLFLISGSGPESRPLGFPDLSLAAVSPKSELALLSFGGTMNIGGGTLLRVPVTGAAPGFVDRSIMSADWMRDGQTLAVVRALDGKNQLEYPAGTVIYRTDGWLSSARVAPNADRIAFIEHPFRHDESGNIMLFETGKGVRTLSEGWVSAGGVSWHPRRQEVWFTAARDENPRSVWAASLDARVRPVAQAPGVLTLRDIAADGRVLLTRETRRLEMAARLSGTSTEQDVSWLDWSRVQELSNDGRLLLFDESGEAAGNRSIAYLRDTQTGVVQRLGDGMAMGLSPDAPLALIAREDRKLLGLVPLNGGTVRWLPNPGLRYQWTRFFPDGRKLLALASRPNEGLRLYVHALDGSGLVGISPHLMIRNAAIAPDGQYVAVLAPNNDLVLYAASGAQEPRIIRPPEPLAPLRWLPDGLIVQHLRKARDTSAVLSRVDVSTGRLTAWKTLQPADRVGVNSITGVALSGDGRSYVYSYRRVLSELFIAAGWR